MKTVLTTDPAEAAAFLIQRCTVAFPTETVYGLGADIFSEIAIANIFRAKGRPADNPLIAHVSDPAQISLLSPEISETAWRFIKAFFPGPLTLVLKKADRVPFASTAGLNTIGVRMPGHQIANEFLIGCGRPVAAPSANLSGRPSPTTWEAVYDDLDGKIDCILQGGPALIGLESTVVDCTSVDPMILRSGAISIEQLREVAPATTIHIYDPNEPVRSPGLKHRHYSPNARVQIVGRDFRIPHAGSTAFIGTEIPQGSPTLVKRCISLADYAHSVFAFFRECDKKNIETIYCEAVPEEGLGKAIMDRLRRAESG